MIGRLFKRKSAAPEAEKNKSSQQEKTSKPNKANAPAGQQSAENKADPKKSRNRRRKPKVKKPATPWDISQFPVEPVEGKTRFHDLNLHNDLLHGIADLGFEYCSPIQAQSLPHSLDGHDVVGKAQTGTGKTAAFLLTIIDDLLRNPIEGERFAGEARALVIAPTRELVIQIADDAKELVKHTDLQVHTLVGGMDYGKQQRKLEDSYVDILVATPGRLLDFCGNQDVHLDQLEIMVIDEADRMLDMGFIPQVRRIIRQTPKKTHRQTLLFSATFTQDVLNLAEQWTIDPVMIEIEPESVATDTVTQKVFMLATEEKYTLLYNVLKQDDVESLIVFANRRDQCRRLFEKLEAHGFKVGILSGDVPQNKRVKTLEGFKTGQLNVLVATDVAGRGIHIDGISHVVNYTLPEEPEDYVHRIGRTGRAGRSGTSISLACEDDALRLEPIETLLGDKLKCEVPPENLLLEHPPLPARKRQSHQSQGRGRTGGGRSGGGRSSGNRRN
ncbi:ATP-dependent RNA helicase RhlB [uncultured Pseudoteredinibacter sp.]|uniref:ATP-dependent RNA helicase RhlB n=1 Tax=uncultured Pseudoteredinibacter sp. TaxID=1641701 RepID=UPI002619A55B|nr:ATP-dependent RNA helicase RhlB [uncultured Pseudoteredinibacter sp.]